MASHTIRIIGALVLAGMTLPGTTFSYGSLNYHRPASSYSSWGK